MILRLNKDSMDSWLSAALASMSANASSSRSSPGSTWRCFGTLPATWVTAASSSPTPTQGDSVHQNLWSFLRVGRGPSFVTEPMVQLDLEAGTICRRNSESRSCHTTVSDIGKRCFYLVGGPKRSGNLPRYLCFRNIFTYVLYLRITSRRRHFDLCRQVDNLTKHGLKMEVNGDTKIMAICKLNAHSTTK